MGSALKTTQNNIFAVPVTARSHTLRDNADGAIVTSNILASKSTYKEETNQQDRGHCVHVQQYQGQLPTWSMLEGHIKHNHT